MSELFHRDPDGATYRRVEQKLEIPMVVLSLLFVPVVLGPLVADLPDRSEDQLFITGAVLWACFAVEFGWLLFVAPNRSQMIRTHKLELVILLLPVLRPLAIVRLAPAASGIRRAFAAAAKVTSRPGIRPYFLCTFGAIFAGAWFALLFERGQPGASIDDFGTALWWSFVTCTTVGYGDHFPITGAGQVVAVALMLVGIGGLSLLTASVAALFVEDDVDDDNVTLAERLDRIEALLRERSV